MRNEATFENKNPAPIAVINQIQCSISEHHLLHDSSGSSSKSSSQKFPVKWRPPLPDKVKCNSDAAFDPNTGKGCAGFVIRNNLGKVEASSYGRLYATSPLRMAMEFVVSLGISSIVFESDNLTLIEACRGGPVQRETRGFILDIAALKERFNYCGFTWIGSKGSMVTHNNASMAMKGTLMGCWVNQPPSLIRNSISKDLQLR